MLITPTDEMLMYFKMTLDDYDYSFWLEDESELVPVITNDNDRREYLEYNGQLYAILYRQKNYPNDVFATRIGYKDVTREEIYELVKAKTVKVSRRRNQLHYEVID